MEEPIVRLVDSKGRQVQPQINRYLRVAAPQGREAEWIGPFLATCTHGNDNPYLNYAIPDDRARPEPHEVDALIGWFAERHRKPRLEYVTAACPKVESVLLACGFAVEGRLPLMVWHADAASSVGPPPNIELVRPETDDELFGMMWVQAEAYASPTPPSRDGIPYARLALEHGGIAIIAREATTRRVVGAGSCSAIVDGLTEVAAIGVAQSHRRRGIAQAVAQRLATEAVARGAVTPFLMAAHDAEARIYERAGFVRSSEILHTSR